jgi:hypothetical protein
MKTELAITVGLVLCAGCSSTENGKVAYRKDGTPVYGLYSRPQSNIGGDGPLMEGAVEQRTMPGQFTGQDGTSSRIGPATGVPQVGTGIVPPAEGTGAGSLGQSGIQPGRAVSSSTLLASPRNPILSPSASTANPPTISSAPTLAEPLTRNGGANIDSTSALGRPAGADIGSGSSLRNNLPEPALSTPNTWQANPLRPMPDSTASSSLASTDLATRVRELLRSGPPGSITTLTPERAQNVEVEAINGNVTLRGAVRSQTERLMLENKVAAISGVSSVNNQLRVIGPARENATNPSEPEQRAILLNREK